MLSSYHKTGEYRKEGEVGKGRNKERKDTFTGVDVYETFE
jgi:hypothetical protein